MRLGGYLRCSRHLCVAYILKPLVKGSIESTLESVEDMIRMPSLMCGQKALDTTSPRNHNSAGNHYYRFHGRCALTISSVRIPGLQRSPSP